MLCDSESTSLCCTTAGRWMIKRRTSWSAVWRVQEMPPPLYNSPTKSNRLLLRPSSESSSITIHCFLRHNTPNFYCTCDVRRIWVTLAWSSAAQTSEMDRTKMAVTICYQHFYFILVLCLLMGRKFHELLEMGELCRSRIPSTTRVALLYWFGSRGSI